MTCTTQAVGQLCGYSNSVVVTGSHTFIHRNNGPHTLGTRQPRGPRDYEGPSEHSATCRPDPNTPPPLAHGQCHSMHRKAGQTTGLTDTLAIRTARQNRSNGIATGDHRARIHGNPGYPAEASTRRATSEEPRACLGRNSSTVGDTLTDSSASAVLGHALLLQATVSQTHGKIKVQLVVALPVLGHRRGAVGLHRLARSVSTAWEAHLGCSGASRSS